MGASNLLTKLIEPIKRFWRKAEHLFSAVLGLNLTINTLSTKKGNLCLVDHLFALTILFGNKYYTASKPVYFPLNGTASVGWAAELSLPMPNNLFCYWFLFWEAVWWCKAASPSVHKQHLSSFEEISMQWDIMQQLFFCFLDNVLYCFNLWI